MLKVDSNTPLPIGKEARIFDQTKRNRRAQRSQIEREVDRARERRRHLQRFYGISVEDFDSLFRNQGERCACCRTSQPDKRGWCVDHDHATGKIRGILCNRCNASIGLNGDSLEKVELALAQQVSYLRGAK